MKIDLSKVMQVYSGRHGCMCGCRGKYKAASRYAEEVEKENGCKVEVSDRSVNFIVSKLEKHPETKFQDSFFFLDTETRSYTVYMTEDFIPNL